LVGDGDYKTALESVTARVLVMPSVTDQYFWHEDSEVEMKHLANGVYAPIDTVWGPFSREVLDA